MRNVVLGGLAGFALVVIALSWQSPDGRVYAAPGAGISSEQGTVFAFSTPLPSGGERITVLDPKTHAMCVYQVGEAGQIELKSVRNIHWDLQMVQLNTSTPLPTEIQSELQVQMPR